MRGKVVFFSWNPETSLPTLPLSSRTGNEIDVQTINFILPTRLNLGIQHGRYKHGGRWVAGIFEVNLAFYWFIVHSYTVYGQFCCSVTCTFARSFNEHPNSYLHTLICYTFDRRSSKFPAEHLSLLLEWFTPFLSPSFLLSSSLSVQYFAQRLFFKHKYCRVVPIHSHLYWNLKREPLGWIQSSRLW